MPSTGPALIITPPGTSFQLVPNSPVHVSARPEHTRKKKKRNMKAESGLWRAVHGTFRKQQGLRQMVMTQPAQAVVLPAPIPHPNTSQIPQGYKLPQRYKGTNNP